MQVEKKSHAPSKPVGRCASFKRSGAWAVLKKNGGKWPVHKKTEKKAAAVRFIAIAWYTSKHCAMALELHAVWTMYCSTRKTD